MNRPARQTQGQMQAACDRFNATYRVGDTITVYTGLIGENPRHAHVRYPAEIMGGHTPVVYVSGGRGCIVLTHTAPPSAQGGE